MANDVVAQRKYAFVVNATISLVVEVTAASLEEAIEKAKAADVRGLCHQCASEEHGRWCTSGDLDCDPSGEDLVDLHIEGRNATEERQAYEVAEELWREGAGG